ncbi:glycosyltransferase WbuB [Mycetocola manganoxydans]|uniref:D-inositol 3-phosphate glycosyltransferase n=2 Tax=Mycetocola manganoxydans TaxID=699879 RepID=A0A3L6ZLJ6_9MICO|nr:glycosyltransferase WbuB [Mycetocola manganoxydans]
MRVTIVGLNYAPEPTGIAPYTAGLAEGLVARGHAVHVVTAYPHYPQWEIAAGYTGRTHEEELDGVSVLRVKPYVPRKLTSLKRLLMELHFGIRAVFSPWEAPDVVILVTPALFATRIVALRARLARTPTCVWVQDIYSLGIAETGAGSRAARAVALIERSTLRAATRVVVIHDRFRRYLSANLGVEQSAVDVVRNWSHIDTDALRHDATIRARFGWEPDDIIVLHAGNMGAKQGLLNVVRASQLADERGSRVRFVLLGDGNMREALEAEGPNSRLQFLDPLPDGAFEAALASADILLVNELPGLTEMSVPSKLTSYFATGLPVIGSVDEDSTTAEELRSAGAGPIVDPTRPIDLLLAAEDLAADPERAARHGRSAQEYRVEMLTADSSISSFAAILFELAASGHSTTTVEYSTAIGPA